ncbi:MAG: hypothetical protein MUF27_10650 [Acidobacteria bacterium]|jgi:hypothetical protein|nr:hypothetical protein [Acidobacteriota bacterium]
MGPPASVRILSLLSALAAAPVLADGTPAEVRMTRPESAAESAIAIDPAQPQRVVAGTMGPLQQVRMHRSGDGGATWSQVELPLGNTCCHPAVAWSSDGRFTYAAALAHCATFRCELLFYRSGDGGASWTDLERDTPGNPRRTVSFSADREALHVDASPASPYRDRIYLPYHSANVMQLARSASFGSAWSAVSLSPAADELGLGGDVATNRAGTVYYAWPAFNSRTIRLRKSIDGGASFGASTVVAATEAAFSFAIPAQPGRRVRMAVSAAADLTAGPHADAVYLAWSDTTGPVQEDPVANHARIRVAASHDGGASWILTTPHRTDDAATVDRFHPALAVSPDGTLHLTFYDTRQVADRSGVDLYYSFSTDGARTWSQARRITTVSSPFINDLFQLGDYNGLDAVGGNLLASFSDNRSESGGSGDSVDVYVARIAPGGGAAGVGRLYGDRGLPGPPLTVARGVQAGDLDLAWAGACAGASDYAVYEGTLGEPRSKTPLRCSTGGATAATITPSSGARFFLVVPRSTSAEGSYGHTSDGAERPADPGACLPQSIAVCP